MDCSVARLESLWLEIGIDRQTLSEHFRTVQNNMETLMDDMIAEVAARRQHLTERIDSLKAEVNKIAAELGQSSPAEVGDCMCIFTEH